MTTRTAGPALYDRGAPRRAVNLSINGDLLSRAKGLTKNLSGTVEELLAAHLQAELTRRRAEDDTLAQIVATLNAFHERHGFLSDEFSDL